MKPNELLNKIKEIQQGLSCCIEKDCAHCNFRDYKGDFILACTSIKDNNAYDIIALYKQLLLSYEDYRNNM